GRELTIGFVQRYLRIPADVLLDDRAGLLGCRHGVAGIGRGGAGSRRRLIAGDQLSLGDRGGDRNHNERQELVRLHGVTSPCRDWLVNSSGPLEPVSAVKGRTPTGLLHGPRGGRTPELDRPDYSVAW